MSSYGIIPLCVKTAFISAAVAVIWLVVCQILKLEEKVNAQCQALAAKTSEIGELHISRDKLLRQVEYVLEHPREHKLLVVKSAIRPPVPFTPANVSQAFIQAIPEARIVLHRAYQDLVYANHGLTRQRDSLRGQCKHLTAEKARLDAAHKYLTSLKTKLRSEVTKLTKSGHRQAEEFAKLAREFGVENVIAENENLKTAVAGYQMELERCRASERNARESVDALQVTNGRLTMDNYMLREELKSARSSRR